MPEREAALSPDKKAYLSLGGNIGDVTGAFSHALAALSSHRRITVVGQSSVWRTKPWGVADQPDFLNMAISIRTTVDPFELLLFCQSLENSAARERGRKWGPRTLDIDIIAYGDVASATEQLTLPHPRAHERLFVLAPMAEMPLILSEILKLEHELI